MSDPLREIWIWIGIDLDGVEWPLIEPQGTRPMIECSADNAGEKLDQAIRAGHAAGMQSVHCVSYRRGTATMWKDLR